MSKIDKLFREDPLLRELSAIQDECIKLVKDRNNIEFINYTNTYLTEKDGIDKLNKLKSILVVTKNVTSFFPEIAEQRKDIYTTYEKLYFSLFGEKAI